MPTNDKKNGTNKKQILISVVVLVVATILGLITGVFKGVEDILGAVTFSKDIIIKLVIVITVMVLLSNLLVMFFEFLKQKKGRVGTVSTVLESLVKYTTAILGACWSLSIIGVDVSTIFASLGIVALILGFGAESLIADIVTGVFILFENQYNVGDIIEVEGFRGTVTEISIRTLSLTDGGGNVKVINNSSLNNVINRSNQSSVAISDIGVAYETDLEELEKKLPAILSAIKEKYTDIFDGEIKFSGVEMLADSAMILRFTAGVTENNIFSGRRILNKELKIAFDKEGISIPYPQMEVRTK